MRCPEADFLDEIQTKVLRVFLLAIHSNFYSFTLIFIFLLTHATSYSFCKGKGGKPDRKPFPLPYGLRNPYRNLQSENSQDYAQKPSGLACKLFFAILAENVVTFYHL
jgi:hypothetical protein